MNVPMPVSTKVWQPVNLKEAFTLKKKFKQEARFIAGGTLMQLQREQGVPFPPHLISLEKIRELASIEERIDGSVRIGSLSDLETSRLHPIVKKACPALAESIGTIASPAVRNRGTIGGNIVYKVGDAVPILMALNTHISWFCEDGIRTEKLSDYISGRSLAEEEAVLADIIIPSQKQGRSFFRKIGRRETFVPSVVTVAVYVLLSDQKEFQEVRIVAGGGLNTPFHLRSCESWLQGKKLTEETLAKLTLNIKKEAALAGDLFASADYRKIAAANLIVSELQKNW